MRLQFQERPWDLYASLGYSAVTTGLLLLLRGGNFFATLLVIFVPGYVLVAALFPGNAEIGWLERLVLSVGLSFAIVPLLGLTLTVTPWGISFVPTVLTIALLTLAVIVVAYVRRMRLPLERRLAATINITVDAWRDSKSLDRGLAIALGASVVAAGASLAYVILTPPSGGQFTEFYVLGPSGNASGYPTSLKVFQPGSVLLGIANHEAAGLNYTVRVDLVGVRIVYNGTSGFNETVEVNRTTLDTFNVILADGRSWTRPYTFWINSTGLWKVQFLLFKDGDFSSPYRELHLFIRVQ